MEETDTTNDFLVSARGEQVAILNPPHRRITKAEALRLAAWLVVMADNEGTTFHRILMAIRNT